MFSENIVIFKGKKDGIDIVLDKAVDFDELVRVFKKKVVDASNFFDGAKCTVNFKGRSLSEEQENQLIEIITQNTGLDISFVNQKRVSQPKKAMDAVHEALEPGSSYRLYRGAVRSGQVLEHVGSIIVLGDVNPGAEVIAQGNIIVLGRLKGMVHAGCAGDLEAFVVALSLLPTQLRIAGQIILLPDKMRKDFEAVPGMAYIEGNNIAVTPLMG